MGLYDIYFLLTDFSRTFYLGRSGFTNTPENPSERDLRGDYVCQIMVARSFLWLCIKDLMFITLLLHVHFCSHNNNSSTIFLFYLCYPLVSLLFISYYSASM